MELELGRNCLLNKISQLVRVHATSRLLHGSSKLWLIGLILLVDDHRYDHRLLLLLEIHLTSSYKLGLHGLLLLRLLIQYRHFFGHLKMLIILLTLIIYLFLGWFSF